MEDLEGVCTAQVCVCVSCDPVCESDHVCALWQLGDALEQSMEDLEGVCTAQVCVSCDPVCESDHVYAPVAAGGRAGAEHGGPGGAAAGE